MMFSLKQFAPAILVFCQMGCGVLPTGSTYVPPSTDNTAVVRPVWEMSLFNKNGANVRIREINGQGLSMIFPYDVVIPSGVVKMGLIAWSGVPVSHSSICIFFNAASSHRYKVTVASYHLDWAVSMTDLTSSGEINLVPLSITHRLYDEATLPCAGLDPVIIG